MKQEMKFKFAFLILLPAQICVIVSSSEQEEGPLAENSRSPSRVNDTTITASYEEPHLRLISKLRDLRLTSGEKAQLKCRADAWPQDEMQFTWYKDSKLFEEDETDKRITIRSRGTTTKLTIKHLLTSDAGTYRCEISNGYFGAHSTGKLRVLFSLPPTDDTPTLSPLIPEGKCEVYRGKACASLLEGKEIFVDPFLTQDEMEQQISVALSYINNLNNVSTECARYAYPSFCNFVFSPCKKKFDPRSRKRKAYPIKLCRKECELMKNDVCSEEYKISQKDAFLKQIFETADCSSLPAISSSNKCTRIGLPSVVDQSHSCYNGSGTGYKGIMSVSADGSLCMSWPPDMSLQHKELSGGHSYCRNPGGEEPKPWCYVAKGIKSECQIEECAVATQNGVSFLVILIPSILIPLLGCFLFVLFCACRRKNSTKESINHKKEAVTDKTISTFKKVNVPELSATSLNYVSLYGEGMYGKVYQAFILPNPILASSLPVIVKTLRNNNFPPDVEEFKKELQIISELQHNNVACLKAFVMQPNLHALVYEYSAGTDLHEFLVRESPQSDFATQDGDKQPSNLSEQNFIQMGIQVTAGMEYLTRNNFIHRDLAARNILVCGNMELKISNLGVVREPYLSCYYRSPQGGQMLPIRWMAPESIHSGKFSDKSTVWSFGILLWEMFNYGSQPYCGYSNQEVLEMIPRGHLLTCPDQCPAKMYSLMQECWSLQPNMRPNFTEVSKKLQAWGKVTTKRMTSKLAQGVNYYLDDVRNDGVVTYTPGSMAFSVDRSSSNTHSSGNYPPQSPPKYSSSLQGRHSHLTSYDARLHTGFRDAEVLQQSGPPFPTAAPVPLGGNSSLPNTQGKQQEVVRVNSASYHRGPGSQSGRSTSSYTSGGGKPLASLRSSKVNAAAEASKYLEGASTPLDRTSEQSHYQEPKRILLEHDREVPSSSQLLVNRNKKSLDANLSDVSSSSVKATSCDSGLPVDDVENAILDSRTPLLERPPVANYHKC